MLPLLNALVDLTAAASAAGPDEGAGPPAGATRGPGTDPGASEACRIPHGEFRLPDSPQASMLAAAAEYMSPQIRPGSLVFLLSDFAGLDERGSAWLARLGRGSEVVMIQVFDPLEALAPPPGLYPATDGVRRGILDTAAERLRAGWERRFAEHNAMLEALCQRHRVHLVRLRTDQPLAEALSLGLGPGRLRRGDGR
jgi:uncharacterized protein (DUF58 family)